MSACELFVKSPVTDSHRSKAIDRTRVLAAIYKAANHQKPDSQAVTRDYQGTTGDLIQINEPQPQSVTMRSFSFSP
jgi:hypothetical protein